jgi:arylsulfatase A-like enzyme
MTSTTGPSHATLFTGRYAPAHGVVRNGVPLGRGAATLAEHLQMRGYRTGGVLGSFVLARRFGFGQGFEHWDEAFERETSSLPMKTWQGHEVPEQGFDRAGAEATRLAVEWLEGAAGDEPFFLFVHYFDAHEPYTPPKEEVARLAEFPLPRDGGPELAPDEATSIRRYDAEIAIVDREVGRLLAALEGLGLAERTLVVVTTDHGQGLADHDDSQHGVNVYDETVRALLLFRGPGVAPPGRASDVPVEAVDVFPTVLDLLEPGSQEGLGLPGRSLAPYLSGGAELDDDRPIYVYRQRYPSRRRVRRTLVDGAQFGIRVGPWKYIEGDRDGRRELYDLASDPRELRNRADEQPERTAELRARLHAWRAAHPRPGGEAPALSDDDRARLRALGYVE